MKYICKICGYVYDEEIEGVPFKDLPNSYKCPICSAPKELFEPVKEEAIKTTEVASSKKTDKKSELTASDIVVETLENCGLKWVLGMVGHSNLAFADAIRKRVADNAMGFISIRHEGCASFAASAYGKLTGKPAACLTIAGPGSTNLITGLYDAKLDSAPVIALTGQIPSSKMGQYLFQEIDLAACFKDLASSQQTLLANSDFGKLALKAYKDSLLNKGVSQIILPDDTQALPASDKQKALSLDYSLLEKQVIPSQFDIDLACEELKKSKKPLILIGYGAKDAIASIKTLSLILKCPMLETYRAKGFMPDAQDNVCGLLGLSGNPVSAKFMSNCDCILAFGVGFSNHTKVDLSKKIIQVDNSLEALGRRCKPAVSVYGDSSLVAEALCNFLKDTSFANQISEILEEKAKWNTEKLELEKMNEKGKISSPLIYGTLSELADENAIISIDVGNIAYDFGKYFVAKNQRMLLSFYLGSIGVGLPSAIGAYCATREIGSEFYNRKVIAVVGDGGFGQYLADWTSCVKYNMNICCIVINNGELAKITKEQNLAKYPVWETTLCNPDFSQYAKACNSLAFRVSDAETLKDSLKKAIEHNGPVLVEILANPKQI